MTGDPSKGHVRIDHTFAHDYLSYDAGVTLQRGLSWPTCQ